MVHYALIVLGLLVAAGTSIWGGSVAKNAVVNTATTAATSAATTAITSSLASVGLTTATTVGDVVRNALTSAGITPGTTVGDVVRAQLATTPTTATTTVTIDTAAATTRATASLGSIRSLEELVPSAIVSPLRERARIIRANYMCGSFPLRQALEDMANFCASRRVSPMTIELSDRIELLARRKAYDNARSGSGDLGTALFAGAVLDEGQATIAETLAKRAVSEAKKGANAWKKFRAIKVPTRESLVVGP